MGPSPSSRAGLARFLPLAWLASLVAVGMGLADLRAPPVAVLCLHAVEAEPGDPWALTPAALEAILDRVQRVGPTLLARQLDGPAPAWTPRVALTFDDGLASHHRVVLPALRRRGMRATFFVPSMARRLDDRQLRDLVAAGMEVGAHSAHHQVMQPREGEGAAFSARLRAATVEARATLEQACGAPVTSFAYPEGVTSGPAVAAVGAAGYVRAFTVDRGHVGALGLELPRLILDRTTTLEQVEQFLEEPSRTAWMRLGVGLAVALGLALAGLGRRRRGAAQPSLGQAECRPA